MNQIELIFFLATIVIFSFVLIQTIEIASFGSRVAGRMANRVALGTTLFQTIYTASRVILIFFLPSLGYLVESGISINSYLNLVFISYILTFISSIFILIYLNSFQKFFQVVFSKYAQNTIPIAIIKSLFVNKDKYVEKNCEVFAINKIVLKKTLVSFLAYIFLITGFFAAFMLAVIFPENRLTYSQFTAAFHGFGALIFAFYLDPMLSRSIDSNEDNVSWIQNIYSILLGRILSYFGVILILLIYMINVDTFSLIE